MNENDRILIFNLIKFAEKNLIQFCKFRKFVGIIEIAEEKLADSTKMLKDSITYVNKGLEDGDIAL